jgi:PAS domain S-box-containing protein
MHSISQFDCRGILFFTVPPTTLNCWSASKGTHWPKDAVPKNRKHDVYDPIAELVRVNPVASIIVDTETLQVVIANEAAAQLLGYPAAELEERSLLAFVPAEDIAAVQQAAEGPPPEGETRWRCLRKDGSLVYVKLKYRDTIFRGRPARFVVATESSTTPFQ